MACGLRGKTASREKDRRFEVVHQRKVPANTGPPEVIAARAVLLEMPAFENEIMVLAIDLLQLEVKKPFDPPDGDFAE